MDGRPAKTKAVTTPRRKASRAVARRQVTVAEKAGRSVARFDRADRRPPLRSVRPSAAAVPQAHSLQAGNACGRRCRRRSAAERRLQPRFQDRLPPQGTGVKSRRSCFSRAARTMRLASLARLKAAAGQRRLRAPRPASKPWNVPFDAGFRTGASPLRQTLSPKSGRVGRGRSFFPARRSPPSRSEAPCRFTVLRRRP